MTRSCFTACVLALSLVGVQLALAFSSGTTVESQNRELGRSKIIGGSAADPKRFPYYTYLRYLSDYDDNNFCGGSLIARDVVLTSASCTGYYGETYEFDVWVNSTTTTYSPYEYYRKSVTLVVHPEYNYDYNGRNDVALVFLNKPTGMLPSRLPAIPPSSLQPLVLV